jgi:hypothetical protein
LKGYYVGEVGVTLYNDLIDKSCDLHNYLVDKQNNEKLSNEEIEWAKSFFDYAQDVLKIIK